MMLSTQAYAGSTQLAIFLFIANVQSVRAVVCGCSASGTPDSVFLQFVASPGARIGTSYCVTGSSCTPPPGYGCYRVNTPGGGKAAFCGTNQEMNMAPGNQAQWLKNLALNLHGTNIPNLGPCTGANLNTDGVCYCDGSNHCNTSPTSNSAQRHTNVSIRVAVLSLPLALFVSLR